ncbi:hypothetical protein P7K49_028790, partial [Saguinus oedipus]
GRNRVPGFISSLHSCFEGDFGRAGSHLEPMAYASRDHDDGGQEKRDGILIEPNICAHLSSSS